MSNNNINIRYWPNSKYCTFSSYFWDWTNRKNFLKEFSNFLSCKVIIKQGSIVQPIEPVLDLKIDIDPSASTKPVTHHGFKIEEVFDIISLVLLYLVCFKLYFLKKLKWLFKDIKLIKICKIFIIETIINK